MREKLASCVKSMEFLWHFNTIDKEYVVIHIRKGADYMKLKKILALFLSVAMVAPSVPLLWTNVQAAQMEGTSSETLEKLRIPSDPISVGEEGENPYGNGAFNMYPRYELMLRDNVNHGSSTLTKVYDYDKNKSGQIWDNQNYSTSRNKSYDASVSTAFDWDGDGRKNHIARVTVNFHYEEGSAFDLDIEDDKGNLLDRTSLGLTSKGELPGYELLTSLAVTSGDYDGDGKDEVAVYRPYNIRGVYPFVNVYKFTKSSSGKPSSKSWVDWYIKDLIGATPDNSATSGFNGAAIVQLESGDLTNDLRDELIVTAGYRKSVGNNTKWMKPKSVILSCEGKETKLSVKAGFEHAWKYSDYNVDDKSGKVQVSAYGASALGDVDGDGKVELVLAGYDINEDSLDSGSTDLNQQQANIAVVEYDEAKRIYYLGAGGVGQSIPVHPNVADGMWDANNHQPIAVKCFSPYGTGNKDLIFVGGMVYELKESATDASYSGVSVPGNHPAKKYGYKCLHQTWCIFPRDDDEVYFGDKDDETDNIWIGTVAAGNFMNNENGGEQLIFEHGRKRDDEGQYRHDLVSIYIDNNGNLASSYTCYNNDQATFYCRNIDLTAIDNDNDSAIMKFKSKAAYFSDPHVIAVLQAAPFFSDLEQLNPDYIEDGETLLGKSSGSGSTDTNGFSISGSVITGYKNEVSFLGITRLGGVDFEVELQASMGGEFEKASEVVYSTEYSSDSLKDRVVLSMTPYIRYVYDLYVPEFKIPTESEYNAKCKELGAKPDGANELKNYKEEIEKVLKKGFRYGQIVPAYTTDYIVCMPQQIRMSMVDVDVYDEMAEVNGFDKIKGNVLTETVGDPFTYPNSSSGMDCFDGGKDIVGDDANVDNGNFIYVSKGGGTVTQSIETSESSSKAITWGAGISTSLVTDGAGVKIGFAASADYTGSHAWTDYSSTVCSGTVAGIPNESVSLGYDFKWRFGQWKDKLNGEECIVLGYLTKDVTAPPYAPKNLTVKDTTDTTVTLNWSHPTSRGKAYEIFLVTNNAHSPYYKLATVSNGITEYTVENLSPNSTYSFVMRSINDTDISTYTLPLTVRTQYPEEANVPKTDKLNDIHTIAGATAFLNAKATPADGGGVVSYQWQRIEVSNNVSEWVNIPGENSEKLELREVKESQNETRYRCEVAQMVGGEVVYVYTNTATLYVLNEIKKPITITAGDLEVEYGMTTEEILVKAAEIEPEISIAGINFEDISDAEPTYTTNYTSGSSVGRYNLNISGLVSDQYYISYVSGNIIVKPKAITVDDIEVTAVDKEYNQTSNANVTATIKDGIKYLGDSVTLEVTGGFEDEKANQNKTVNYAITGIGGPNSTNYTLQPDIITGALSASIWPAEVKFSISVTSFVYNGEPHAVEIDANCAGDLFTDFIVKYNNEELAPTQAGSYPITIEMSENYTGAPEDLELVIFPSDQKELIITGLPRTVEYGGAFMLKTVGGEGDGVVTWSSSDPSIAEIHADTGEVKILRSGKEVTITATKAASENYNEQSTSITFVPDKKAVTFKLYDLLQSYDGAVKKVSVKAMDSVTYEVAYTDATGKDIDEPVNAGMYYVTVVATGNYEGKAEGILTISKAEIDTNPTLEINNGVYGQPISSAILIGNPDGTQAIITYVGTGIYTPQSSMPKNAGSYTAIAEISGENYETLTVVKEFVIEKAVITVTIQPASRQYGEENPEFELTYSGFEYDEDESVFLEVPKTKCSAKANSSVGMYDITASYGRADNYTFDYTAKGTLTVSPMDEDTLFIIGSNRDVFVGEEFVLHAYCGSIMPKVIWSSSDESIATVDENGRVKALLSGTVNITATLNDPNYYQQSAEFILHVIKKNIMLMPINTVCIFNNKEQSVSFISSDSGFVPTADNVRVTYTLTTKPSVTIAKGVGVYSCLYEVNDNKYAGVGEFTFYINKVENHKKDKDKSSGKGGVVGKSSAVVQYTVSFDSDGGSNVSNIKVSKNNTVSMPTNPTKDGYIFKGWFTDKKFKVEYDFDTKVNKNTTLYAKWNKKAVESEQIPAFPVDGNEEEAYVEQKQTPIEKEWRNPFKDVAENNWFYPAVKYAVENKLFNGMSETEFSPDEAITRGMLVTVLYLAESKPESSEISKFEDVAEDTYYAKAVVWAEANGIVKGVSEKEFAPDKLITREEIATIMKVYAEFKGITTDERVDLARFTDAKEISGWARSNMEWAIGYGLIFGKGNGRLDSQGNVTRAEAATILQSFFEKIK